MYKTIWFNVNRDKRKKPDNIVLGIDISII